MFSFGLLCLLIARNDFKLVERVGGTRPLTIAFSATYVAIPCRYWFLRPVIITDAATACFTIAAVLSS